MSWDDLARELDAWGAAGRTATLWWRDDDAQEPTSALDRLLDLSHETGTPLGLAVIPAGCAETWPGALGGAPVTVLQHGYAHVNHAAPPAKKCELGDDRPLNTARAELEAGRSRLVAAFGPGFLSVLVPPWNRISPSVHNLLENMDFQGLSAFGPRPASTGDGLRQVNTHVDLIDWRGTRGFVGEAAALGVLTGHLAARRTGAADPEDPTGILSHHLDHDAGCWTFLESLFSSTAGHPAVRWLDPTAIFGAATFGGPAS